MMVHVGLLAQILSREGEGHEGRLPPILPIVVLLEPPADH
jgi:hypothetical protein